MSPTISSAACLGTAASSARMSMTSTIDASSTTSRSQSIGLLASRLKLPVAGSPSSRRWMVVASIPVASFILRAARPVGAHSRRSTPCTARMRRMVSISVVLPTPGPPVTMVVFDVSASRAASAWWAASDRPVCCSVRSSARSMSMAGQGGSPAARSASRAARPRAGVGGTRTACSWESLQPQRARSRRRVGPGEESRRGDGALCAGSGARAPSRRVTVAAVGQEALEESFHLRHAFVEVGDLAQDRVEPRVHRVQLVVELP